MVSYGVATHIEKNIKNKKKILILKRIFDIFFSFIGLTILSPIFLIVGIIIKVDSDGPIFFRQLRIGKNGKEFEIIKFRTMIHTRENTGLLLTVGDDPRVTKIGKLLRKHKIDEFPQLINVLFGEMSFVGPRPQVAKYVEEYGDFRHLILMVRPGITDYASVEYNHESELLGQYDDPEEVYINHILPIKLELNLKYLEEISIITDFKLIFITLYKLFK